jgi:hypothetical protein
MSCVIVVTALCGVARRIRRLDGYGIFVRAAVRAPAHRGCYEEAAFDLGRQNQQASAEGLTAFCLPGKNGK